MGIQTITQGKVVCIFFADGTMEYRDRLTMEEIYNEPARDRIMSLHQVGFSFTDPTPCESFFLWRYIAEWSESTHTNPCSPSIRLVAYKHIASTIMPGRRDQVEAAPVH